MTTNGLLLALSRPPAGNEAGFNRWYDDEHAPGRLTVPGFLTARRYRDLQSEQGYLAYYDVESTSVFDHPLYRKLQQETSPLEREMLSSAQLLDRRVYERLATPPETHGDEPDICGDCLLCVWWTPPEPDLEDFHAWYNEEHLPMLMKVPGWLRARRFRLVDGRGPAFVALHDLESERVLNHPAHDAAVNTPWRDRVVQVRKDYDRRLYRLWRRFD